METERRLVIFLGFREPRMGAITKEYRVMGDVENILKLQVAAKVVQLCE